MTMTTDPAAPVLALGDVVQDSYGNPAVIVRIGDGSGPIHYGIMQTCGSDRGHVTYAPGLLLQITDQARIDWARDIVRAEARRQGWKWNAQGITR